MRLSCGKVKNVRPKPLLNSASRLTHIGVRPYDHCLLAARCFHQNFDSPSNGKSACRSFAACPNSARTDSAARYPLRTAPSIVEGHPVCVQSPERNKFSIDVFCGGRQRSTPGSGENVAFTSLMTVAFNTFASRVSGSTSAISRRRSSIISRRDRGTKSYDALITSCRYWPSSAS